MIFFKKGFYSENYWPSFHTRARSGGAGLPAAALAAVTSRSALVGHTGGGAAGAGGGGAHGRPGDPAVGGAQQPPG